MVKLFIPLFLLLFLTFFPKQAIATPEEKSYPSNYSFESWSLQNGSLLPNDWIIIQATNPEKQIRRSQDLLDGVYSLELTPNKTTVPESTSPKAVSIRSHLFYVDNYTTDLKPLKLIVWVKPTSTLAETRGALELLGYKGNTLCSEKFTVPQTERNWTKQTLVCNSSSFKVSAVITQNSPQPVHYDKVTVTQLD